MSFIEPAGELTVMDPWGNGETLPTYTCGHCSKVIVLRPDRVRERKRCFSCFRTICEKSEICNAACTPLHAMARDHFEGAGIWAKFVPAIMAGAATLADAERKGVIVNG